MKPIIGLAFIAALAAPGISAAQNSIIATTNFNGWQISSFRSPSTGQFTHCAASANYRSGITLLFSINSRTQWNIGFVHRDWTLSQGKDIPLQFNVDNAPPRPGVATAINTTHAVMGLPGDSQLFQQMRSGQMLFVTAAGQNFQFRLTGTSVVLQTLLRCANSNGTDVATQTQTAAPAPPPTPQQREAPPPRPPSGPTAEQRLEATQFAANLLAEDDMRRFRLLTSSELRASSLSDFFKASDVVWQGDGVTGSIRILSGHTRSLDAIAAEIIGADARDCRGEFITGRTADADLPDIRRVQTFCSNAGGRQAVVAYLFLPMPGGVIYQISTMGRPDRQAASTEDQRVRDAVRSVVLRDTGSGTPRQGSGPATMTPAVEGPARRL
ncbi:hypothetical protein [Sediminicoccus sp. BL-A-41-H5]|uniref:hypothetical protein n=1 Tax=Sediminicoccus sp. BL-A-41-H5 TaxID=3421106 RepID=UPI003D67B234